MTRIHTTYCDWLSIILVMNDWMMEWLASYADMDPIYAIVTIISHSYALDTPASSVIINYILSNQSKTNKQTFPTAYSIQSPSINQR